MSGQASHLINLTLGEHTSSLSPSQILADSIRLVMSINVNISKSPDPTPSLSDPQVSQSSFKSVS